MFKKAANEAAATVFNVKQPEHRVVATASDV
jgi:hypothetical protein